MVNFYSGNVTPTVCGKSVKIYHSQTYATIQVSSVHEDSVCQPSTVELLCNVPVLLAEWESGIRGTDSTLQIL